MVQNYLATVLLDALHLPFLIPAADGLPFVVFFLALGQPDFHLDVAVPKVELERDEGKAFFFGFADESSNFPPVQEKFAGAGGVIGILGGEGIGADMGVVEIDLALLDAGKAIVNVGLPHTDGFNFGAAENNAGFNDVVDEVIEVGLTILADDFHWVVFHVKNAFSDQLSAEKY